MGTVGISLPLVGDWLGLALDDSLGLTLGPLLGLPLGDILRLSLNVSDGPSDGDIDGKSIKLEVTVGRTLGISEGADEVEGLLDGEKPMKLSSGLSLGTSEGAADREEGSMISTNPPGSVPLSALAFVLLFIPSMKSCNVMKPCVPLLGPSNRNLSDPNSSTIVSGSNNGLVPPQPVQCTPAIHRVSKKERPFCTGTAV